MALPLKYNIRNIIVRKGSTLATAFTIGLTVAVFLMVMALARYSVQVHQIVEVLARQRTVQLGGTALTQHNYVQWFATARER